MEQQVVPHFVTGMYFSIRMPPVMEVPVKLVRLTLRCPAQLSTLAQVRDHAVQFARQWQTNEDFLDAVRLAVGEGASNAIRHGCAAITDCFVEVECWKSEHGLAIEIRDPGPGFDPEAVPLPDFERESGRGIFFMRTLMDDVQYTFPGNGTRLFMSKSWG